MYIHIYICIYVYNVCADLRCSAQEMLHEAVLAYEVGSATPDGESERNQDDSNSENDSPNPNGRNSHAAEAILGEPPSLGSSILGSSILGAQSILGADESGEEYLGGAPASTRISAANSVDVLGTALASSSTFAKSGSRVNLQVILYQIFVSLFGDCGLVNNTFGIQHPFHRPPPPVICCNQHCARCGFPPPPPVLPFNIQYW